ncbi:MAG: Hsp20/alpha crystallin family protein [Anaerolineales bacterium]|nr:Hsp20/alpha crystallin family protein [Anaerolineales bacterium]
MPNVPREMDKLQREMNRLFDSTFSRKYRNAPSFPAVNVWANEDGLVVTSEVPGINVDDIDIVVVGETLTLSGNRGWDELNEDTKYHRQERGYGDFTRTVKLPFLVDADKVDASFIDGVLNITLPRKDEDKPTKITVSAG